MDDLPYNRDIGTSSTSSAEEVTKGSASLTLTAQVVRGAAWSIVGTVAQRIFTFGAAIVVARLLSPTDYAIAGLATASMGILTTFAVQGFAYALVQQRELSEAISHSVFWFTTATGIGLCLIAIAVSPLLADFYHQQGIETVIWVLSLGLAVNMIGAVPTALLQRAMRFREINLVSVIGGGVAAILGIGLAVKGYGYWALILPSIGAALAMAIGALWLSGYRPARMFRWSALREVSPFGFSMLGSSVVMYFSENSDYLILGRFWSSADFGQYYFAFERSRQVYYLIMTQLASAVFPAFSRVQDDLERLRRGYLHATFSVCLIIFPLHVLLIGLADPLVPWVFGEQWRPAIPVFQLFTLFAFVRGVIALTGDVLLALNRAQVALAYNVFRIAVILPALLYLGFSRANSLTVATVLVVVWMAQTPVLLAYVYRLLRLNWLESWRSLQPSIIITVMMALVLVATRLGAQAVALPMWVTVALSALLSSAVYVALARRPIVQVVSQIRSAFGKS